MTSLNARRCGPGDLRRAAQASQRAMEGAAPGPPVTRTRLPHAARTQPQAWRSRRQSWVTIWTDDPWRWSRRVPRGSVGPVIAHVALETAPADAAAATSFWQEVGFVLVDPPPTLADRAAWLERRGTQIHLLWTDQPTAQTRGSRRDRRARLPGDARSPAHSRARGRPASRALGLPPDLRPRARRPPRRVDGRRAGRRTPDRRLSRLARPATSGRPAATWRAWPGGAGCAPPGARPHGRRAGGSAGRHGPWPGRSGRRPASRRSARPWPSR